MLSGNDEITRLNSDSDVTTTMNLVVVSSRVLHASVALIQNNIEDPSKYLP